MQRHSTAQPQVDAATQYSTAHRWTQRHNTAQHTGGCSDTAPHSHRWMQGATHYLLCIFRSKCDHGALSCDGSCHLIHLRPRQMLSRSSTHHPALKHTGPGPLTQRTTHTHTENHVHTHRGPCPHTQRTMPTLSTNCLICLLNQEKWVSLATLFN